MRDTGGVPQRPISKPYPKNAPKPSKLPKEGKWTEECPPKKMTHRKLEMVGSVKGKMKGYDRVFPKGTMKISKDPNKGYSRSNPTGRDR